jgi:hypothetical protein
MSTAMSETDWTSAATKTDIDWTRLRPYRVQMIVDRLAALHRHPHAVKIVGGELHIPNRLVRVVQALGSDAVPRAMAAARARCVPNDTPGWQHHRLASFVFACYEAGADIDEITELLEEDDALINRSDIVGSILCELTGDPKYIPTQLIGKDHKERTEARQKEYAEAREEAARRPLPPLAVPMEQQRGIVTAYIQGHSIDEIADLYDYQAGAVITVLQDAGYAVSIAEEATRES